MKNYLLIFIAICTITSCSKNAVDKSIILKIGNIEISKYEFEKSKNRLLNQSAKDSGTLNDSKLFKLFREEYINKCYLLADAYSKKYDTSIFINKKVQSACDYQMTDRYGYLWQNTISPIVNSAMELTDEKLNKRKKLFYFDCISFDNINNLKKIINNDTLISKETFYKLKNAKFCNSRYFSAQWPFISFWKNKDYIYNMQEGSVSKLLKINNTHAFLYLDHIEEVTLSKRDKDIVKGELQIGTEEDIIEKGRKEIETKCKPVLNDKNIEIIEKFLSQGNSFIQFKDDFELMRYTINDTLRILHFNKFKEYYSLLPIRMDISNIDVLKAYVLDYCNNDYMINEANALNLYNSDEVIYNNKSYRNNLIFEEYVKHEINNKINIDTSEIIHYYEKNKSFFKQPKNIVVSLYKFNNMNDALKNRPLILRLIKNKENDKIRDTSVIKDLKDIKTHVNYDVDDFKNYPADFTNSLISTRVGNISQRPVKFQNNYVLIYKEEEKGESIKKLVDVYPYIKFKVNEDKTKTEIKKFADYLKKKYKIEIDKTGI